MNPQAKIMKNWVKAAAVISIAAIAFGCGTDTKRSVAGTENDTRFETVTEYHSSNEVGIKIYFTVVRDKKEGIEYTCVYSRNEYPMSVFSNDINKHEKEVK